MTGCNIADIGDALYGTQLLMPSVSMEPTLARGKAITSAEVKPADLQRGDIVVLKIGEEKRITRLVGMPGDRVAMDQGIVILNGQPVQQRIAGVWRIQNNLPKVDYTMLEEQFPGEKAPHRILESGPTSGDNYPEITLEEGKYFLLGDNRDRAADSRFPSGNGGFGLGIVDQTQITDRVEPE